MKEEAEALRLAIEAAKNRPLDLHRVQALIHAARQLLVAIEQDAATVRKYQCNQCGFIWRIFAKRLNTESWAGQVCGDISATGQEPGCTGILKRVAVAPSVEALAALSADLVRIVEEAKASLLDRHAPPPDLTSLRGCHLVSLMQDEEIKESARIAILSDDLMRFESLALTMGQKAKAEVADDVFALLSGDRPTSTDS